MRLPDATIDDLFAVLGLAAEAGAAMDVLWDVLGLAAGTGLRRTSMLLSALPLPLPLERVGAGLLDPQPMMRILWRDVCTYCGGIVTIVCL